VPPWVYDDIIEHQGPLKQTDPFYKGSSWNVSCLPDNGEETYEPLYEMIKDDLILVAKNAKEQGLLDTSGWKKLQKFARRIKKFLRMIKHAKLQRGPCEICFEFGVQVPIAVLASPPTLLSDLLVNAVGLVTVLVTVCGLQAQSRRT
jgi:hypothetical protein